MPDPDVSIEFDNDKINYRPGDLLTGRVLVRSDSPLTVKGIHISFKGDVHVQWRASGSRIDGTESIVNNLQTVYGSTPDKTDRPTLTMAKGDHTFQFGFTIPLTHSNGSPLPGSFDEVGLFDSFNNLPITKATIRYYVECHVERPTTKLEMRVSRDVRLLGSIDLKNTPGSAEPQEVQRSKDIICCCSAGQIDVMIKTDKGGYIPGETMRVSVKIVDRSPKNIKKADIYLAKTSTYVSNYGARWKEVKILSMIDRGSSFKVKSEEMHDIEEQEVLVPLGLEPTLPPGTCRVLSVAYSVRMDISLDPFNMELPITIGSATPEEENRGKE